jgi:hypothetical protein
MSSPDSDQKEPPLENPLGLRQVADQIVQGLNSLEKLSQLAMPDKNAQLEAQRLLGQVADNLTRLILRYDEGDFNKTTFELAENLRELARKGHPANAHTEPEAEVNEQEALRHSFNMALFERTRNGQEDEEEVLAPLRRRVLIASLEQLDSTPPLVAIATQSFDREKWDVTNLGNRVPIMALTSTVREVRPGVLVMVIARGQFISETARLIDDLKRTFIGLKVVLVGPPFASQSNLGERLGADLYAAEVESAAELSDHALTPLGHLAEPLALSLEEAPHEELRENSGQADEAKTQMETTGDTEETRQPEEASPIEEVPTVKPSDLEQAS